MQELTTDQLKELLKTPFIKGTPDQIRLLARRVVELRDINGRAWVEANAVQLLLQWERVLDRMAREPATHPSDKVPTNHN